MSFWAPSSCKTYFFNLSKKLRNGSLGIKNSIFREDGANMCKTWCLKGFKFGGSKNNILCEDGAKKYENWSLNNALNQALRMSFWVPSSSKSRFLDPPAKGPKRFSGDQKIAFCARMGPKRGPDLRRFSKVAFRTFWHHPHTKCCFLTPQFKAF